MEITHAKALSIADQQADFSFDICQIVAEPYHAVPLQLTSVAPHTKAYSLDKSLFHFFDGDDRALFTAREAGRLAGYIAVSRGWNGCSVIDDFAVAREFRRRGLATTLMNCAVKWTREAGLGAIRLETQSNNSAACRFYQPFGFVLGGYDRLLYSKLGPDISQEVALFWYLNI